MTDPCPGAGEAWDEACALCGRPDAALCKRCAALATCPACSHDCALFAAWMATDPPPASGTTTTTTCTILEDAGVHDCGVWRRVCRHGGGGAWGVYAPPLPPASSRPAPLPDLRAVFRLCPSSRGVPALNRLTQAGDPPLHPALALLLHRPATAVRALARALEQEGGVGDSQTKITLAVLGTRVEIDAWPALLYMPCLLRGGSGRTFEELHIACVGPDVPARLDGASAVFEGPAGGVAATTRISFSRGLWHEVSHALSRPDAAATLDAGLAAEPGSWAPTLQALAGGIPILLTDLSLPAAVGAVGIARAALAGAAVAVTDPVRNPDRRPIPCPRSPGTLRLPCHECGWAFWVERRMV